MALKDAVADGQAQPDAASRLFGRKKGFKDARQNFGWNASAVVSHHDTNVVRFVTKAGNDPQVTALRKGVEGIQHQRENYLLDLRSIAKDRRQIGVELRLHLNSGKIQLM